MNAKRMLLIGTMAAALSFSSGIGATKTSADPLDKSNVTYIAQPEEKEAPNDDLQQLLGVSSDQEIYDALYAGQSLADIANANHTHVQHVINLQVAELTAQLDARLASGSLSVATYHLQKAELEEMVTTSTYASHPFS
ncbi:hypothetical protein Back11_42660 [Paenibacillus baekrokdamisoli]|uniref:Uncharacterized protein n=1 Tax=Paenibacillus baekrokdamisoli TaxID=1712516 RepID=A0A3G9JAM1_9BACL|nr:hypothetical protein [Paenibacillus baekrokdamisoli]MBB3068031.1 hypothetical protein [Paenibacillus baekrokdamisoli]BBH22921.1 hypothetical protein Back11_42660 [Paenibacillus baekrokdamisoli]